MNKNFIIGLVGAIGLAFATGAHALSATGTVTSLVTNVNGINYFKLSSGFTKFYIFDPATDPFYVNSSTFQAMLGRVMAAYSGNKTITIIYSLNNCGLNYVSCPIEIQ